jgi:hypothetical protein
MTTKTRNPNRAKSPRETAASGSSGMSAAMWSSAYG